MALGAPKGVVLRAVLLEGAMMTLIGMVGGAAIAALFSGDHQPRSGRPSDALTSTDDIALLARFDTSVEPRHMG